MRIATPIPGAEGWWATFYHRVEDGVIKQYPIVLEPRIPNPKPLTAAALRKLGLGNLQRHIRRELERPVNLFWMPDEWLDAVFDVTRPGRRGAPPLKLALEAKDYVEAANNKPGEMLTTLAQRWHTTTSAVEGRINRLRSKGWVEGERGKPQLTDRARAQLLLLDKGT